MSKIINVTNNFRISQDSLQYSIQQYVTIDPSKSPRNRNAKDKEKLQIKQEWRDINAYYGLSASGLSAAIKKIIILEAGISGEGDIGLKEYVQLIKELADGIDKAIHSL